MIQEHPHETNGSREPQQITFTFDDRQWRVRGLEKQLSCERLRVNLLVSRRELVHVDTLDLYVARQRHTFLRQAAAELYVEEATIKRDLGRVLLQLEARQELLIREKLGPRTAQVPVMSQAERDEALQLLKDPQLIERILQDYDACGLVGEETNKLVCYLACTSRLLPRPLAVLVQSSSAAGKTTLQESVLRFMPPDAQVRLSALTAQSLYYMPAGHLKHKILSVAEEDGLAQAAYALKLLQSDGRLSIACAGKDADTGRQQTQLYEVEGPVAMLLTTTAETPHPELANRCLVVSANEQPQQTAAIHQRQRWHYQPHSARAGAAAVARRHQDAQRLLQPLRVVIPWADQLTFRTDQTRYRRDHATYLVLIASITLLHQYQRKQFTRGQQGQPQQYVVATLEDLDLANRLASEVLCEHVDSLMPQTRRLLCELRGYVTRRGQAEGLPPREVRFTQRQLREALERSDRAVRTHLSRLVQLEYVLVHRTGRGNQREYQLLVDAGDLQRSHLSRLGLADVKQLRGDPPRHG
jgi:DNA primase